MNSNVKFVCALIGLAVWLLFFCLPAGMTVLWLLLLWVVMGLCQLMLLQRAAWNRLAKGVMTAVLVLLAFAILLGLQMPYAAALFHAAWIPALGLALLLPW